MKNEMGGQTGERSGACRVSVGKPARERDHLEDQGIDGSIILKWVFEKLEGGVGWIDLSQDSKNWWALANAVMELQVP
jgi:hypothetical protein